MTNQETSSYPAPIFNMDDECYELWTNCSNELQIMEEVFNTTVSTRNVPDVCLEKNQCLAAQFNSRFNLCKLVHRLG